MNLIERLKLKLMSRAEYTDYLKSLGVQIGNRCEIYKETDFGSEPYLITIGNHVRITSGVQFFTHDGGVWVLRDERAGFRDEFSDADSFGRIIVDDNVHIGRNALIMPGVHIGKNSIVACGAVVTHDVPENTIVGGVPAKKIESLNEYADKIRRKMINTKHMSDADKKALLLSAINETFDD